MDFDGVDQPLLFEVPTPTTQNSNGDAPKRRRLHRVRSAPMQLAAFGPTDINGYITLPFFRA